MGTPSCGLSIRIQQLSRFFIVASALIFAVPALSQSTALTLAAGSTVPGGTVSLDLSLSATTAPSALQWALSYNPADVAAITVSPGSTVSAAGKAITCNPGTGTVQCIASGLNTNAIANGAVATVNVTLAQNITSTAVPVGFTSVMAASASGTGMSATAAGSSIAVQQLPATISGLSCGPATLATPGSVTCTVTLTAAALPNSMTITLTDDSSNLTIPSSVVVPSGSSSATFTGSSVAVSNSQTAVITASVANKSAVATLTLLPPGSALSIWNSSATPNSIDSNDTGAVELGVKFRSDVAGLVTGVRFYKSAANTGTHTGHLWTSTGTSLGSVTFTNETASGWQQAKFAAPIPINANTTYVVSYFAPKGHYSDNVGFFASAGVDSPPLHALANGVDGANGVYKYGSTSSFPNLSWSTTNYWVDVVFSSNVPVVPVSVAVNPTSPALAATQSQQFSASVTGGSGNTAVTWSLSPTVGTLSNTGLYSAPATIATQQTVTVTATSVADPTKSASATITLRTPVSVTLNPTSASLAATQSQQFSASVTGGSGNTAVTWSLSPTVGTLSNTGLYSAPATIATQQTVTVTATSVADPTKSASATITLRIPVSVAVNPTSTALAATQSQQFSASVTGGSGNTAVTWSLSPTVGTLSNTGLYSAPATIATQQTVTVTATSVADPTKSASATITLRAPCSVTLNPTSASLAATQSQQFSASVTGGSGNTAVTWSLSPTVGTLSNTGLYSAPATIATQQTVTVTATSVADPTKSASATITLRTPVSVTLNPTSASLAATQSQQFSASVTGGSGNTAVTWSLSPTVGTLSNTGLYSAPATIATQQTVTVTATSVADPTKSASATITLRIPVSVAVNPTSTALAATQSQQFSASVTGGSGNTAVTWSLSPTVGTLSNTGLYSAPATIATQQTVTVTATSVADPTKSASATITLRIPVSVAVNPTSTALAATQSQQFSASVTGGSGNTAVTWSLSPTVGTLSNTGLYSAPTTIATQQTVTVTATSVADPTKSASATITLRTPVSVAMSVWDSWAAPIILDGGDSAAVEVGMKFRSDVTGAVSGVRFYKSIANTGKHIGHLWSSTGALLGTVTFTNETDSGWQQGDFATPIPIDANTTYVVSYFAPKGHYSYDTGVFASAGIDSAPLHALANGADGPNGVYRYGSTSKFPNLSWKTTNYWVDLVFATATPQLSTSTGAGSKSTMAKDTSSNTQVDISHASEPFNRGEFAITPSNASLGPLQSQRFTVLNESSGEHIRWSLTPSMGFVTGDGLYVAPANVRSAQEVTLLAENTNGKSASVIITLVPDAISPARTELSAGQHIQFAAQFSHLLDPSATWSIEPAVGTISAATGLYVAPSEDLTSTQTVTVTAVSRIDPDRTATAILTVQPQTLMPRAINLTAGQSHNFITEFDQSDNPLVWALTPSIGTVSSNGYYVAPAEVASKQTVILNVSRASEPDNPARVTITLLPLSMNPQTPSVSPGQTQQFAVVDENGRTLDARWTVVPQAGTISSTGEYSAPVTLRWATTVTVIAEPLSRPGETVSATVTLLPSDPELVGLSCPKQMGPTLCTLTLSAPAPADGVDITLRSSGVAAPPSWHIVGGALRSSFPATVLSTGAHLTAIRGTSLQENLVP